MKSSMNKRGSILIEAILAVFILSVAVIALMRVSALSLRAGNKYQQFSEVEEIGEKVLYDIEVGNRADLIMNGAKGHRNNMYFKIDLREEQADLKRLEIHFFDDLGKRKPGTIRMLKNL